MQTAIHAFIEQEGDILISTADDYSTLIYTSALGALPEA